MVGCIHSDSHSQSSTLSIPFLLMGNCATTQPHKTTAEIAPAAAITKPPPPPPPLIKLYGPPDSFATSHIRLALLYKPVTIQFLPSADHDSPTLVYQSDVVSGSTEDILRYLDAKFPDPASAVENPGENIWGWCRGETIPPVVRVVVLQHRSIGWHLERMVKWAEEMAARGGRANHGDPAMGSPRMEVKKFGKRYAQVLQLMLEHAQMEETVVFQILDAAERGLCKSANEEHARQLPLMNGIKEEVKTVGVMNPGSPVYREALANLTSRLKELKDNCKKHFDDEERELLPLMEATELTKLQLEKVLEQSLDVMRETHSNLFRFFMEGLRPHDAMDYFDLIKMHCDNARVSLMLHMMVG